MNTNIHSQQIPNEKLQEAESLINQLYELLKPYGVPPLTATDKQDLLILGDKSIAFMDKAYEQAVLNPQVVPAYMSMDEFAIDRADALELRKLRVSLAKVETLIGDTETVAGSEAYRAALAFYSAVKLQASQGVRESQVVYDELRKRYPSGRHKKAAAADSKSVTTAE